jgi:hypothetical protein
MPWFSNRGQIIQLVITAAAFVLAASAKFGLPHIPPWVLPASLGGAGGLALGLIVQLSVRRPRPTSGPNGDFESQLTVSSVEFREDDNPDIRYKRKLYIKLRNDGASPVVLGPETAWQDRYFQPNPVSEHVWQLEALSGLRRGGWDKERPAVFVRPGQSARTWIGLPNHLTSADVEKARKAGQIGSLKLLVSPANEVEIAV